MKKIRNTKGEGELFAHGVMKKKLDHAGMCIETSYYRDQELK